MTPATHALLEQVQSLPDVARARRKVTLYGRADPGLALARITAAAMVNDLLEEVGEHLDRGLTPSTAWLEGRLRLARYQRVTFVELFAGWARLTRAAVASRWSAPSGRPAHHDPQEALHHRDGEPALTPERPKFCTARLDGVSTPGGTPLVAVRLLPQERERLVAAARREGTNHSEVLRRLINSLPAPDDPADPE